MPIYTEDAAEFVRYHVTIDDYIAEIEKRLDEVETALKAKTEMLDALASAAGYVAGETCSASDIIERLRSRG